MIFLCGAKTVFANEPLMVFAAASLSDVLKEIALDFKRQYNQNVDFNFGGSSALRVEIENGAVCDIFLAADKASLQKLSAQNMIESQSMINLLKNDLVVVGQWDNQRDLNNLKDLSFSAGDHLAIADPQSAPAGVYAMQALKKMGLNEKFKDFIAPTLDVRAALALVISGNAKYAIVYSSDAKSFSKVKVLYQIPAQLHEPIVYAAAVIKSSDQRDAAKNFVSFLQTPTCKIIFEKYGFKSF